MLFALFVFWLTIVLLLFVAITRIMWLLSIAGIAVAALMLLTMVDNEDE